MTSSQIPYATEQGNSKRASGNSFEGTGNLIERRKRPLCARLFCACQTRSVLGAQGVWQLAGEIQSRPRAASTTSISVAAGVSCPASAVSALMTTTTAAATATPITVPIAAIIRLRTITTDIRQYRGPHCECAGVSLGECDDKICTVCSAGGEAGQGEGGRGFFAFRRTLGER